MIAENLAEKLDLDGSDRILRIADVGTGTGYAILILADLKKSISLTLQHLAG